MKERRYRMLALNPVISDRFDAWNREFLSARIDPRFDLAVESLEYGTETVETEYDEALVAPFLVERVIDAERRGFDAALIDCFFDPGLAAAREATDLVVTGAGESAMLTALALGDTFSILDLSVATFKRRTAPPRVRKLGLASRFVSHWGTGITVKRSADEKALAGKLTKAALELVRADEPDVVILGCTGLSQVAELVAARLPVPLVDPQLAALRTAESLVRSGLKHSRRTYPRPVPMSRKVPGTRLR